MCALKRDATVHTCQDARVEVQEQLAGVSSLPWYTPAKMYAWRSESSWQGSALSLHL